MTTNNWNDFNDAESQQSGFDLIPKGTIVPVRMTIKPGGYDDPTQGWGGGYATESFNTGSIYLAAEFVVTAGDHAKRKMWRPALQEGADLGADGSQLHPCRAQQRP
jgi:hypothetical protein